MIDEYDDSDDHAAVDVSADAADGDAAIQKTWRRGLTLYSGWVTLIHGCRKTAISSRHCWVLGKIRNQRHNMLVLTTLYDMTSSRKWLTKVRWRQWCNKYECDDDDDDDDSATDVVVLDDDDDKCKKEVYKRRL